MQKKGVRERRRKSRACLDCPPYNPADTLFYRSKKSRDDDDSMDVDDEEAGGDTEEDEPEMSVDEDEEDEDETQGSSPKKNKKRKGSKLKPRKSQIDVTAVAEEQKVLATYDDQEITQQRLQKKYLSEALTFIDEIESAMEPMGRLLGSMSKPEVLEIMEFFRIAHEYHFESAKVCLFSFAAPMVSWTI